MRTTPTTTLLLVIAAASELGCGAAQSSKSTDADRAGERHVIVATKPAPAPAPAAIVVAPAAPEPTTPFGNGIRSVRFERSTVVYKTPGRGAEKAGVVKKGTRAAVKSLGAEGDGCDRWLEIAPRGWTCASAVVPSLEPPMQAATATLADEDPDAPLVAGVYGVVRRGAIAYRSVADIQAGAGRALAGSNTVRAAGAVTVDGTRYWRTSRGDLIAAGSIGRIGPSAWKGVALAEGDALPAWVRNHEDARDPVITRSATGARVRELPARTVVTVLEDDGTRVRVADDEWLARRDLRIASLVEPPPGTGDAERWFDVDLAQQVLVAYEGKRPVYATLVSTGKSGHWTPSLVARVVTKHESTPMVSDKGDIYSVADVPWTMFYDGNYALHTSYWHDGFGGPRSHGCINLSPRDARLLYRWSSPDVPPGWSTVYADEDHPGSLVRVRARGVEQPPFRGYAKKLLTR